MLRGRYDETAPVEFRLNQVMISCEIPARITTNTNNQVQRKTKSLLRRILDDFWRLTPRGIWLIYGLAAFFFRPNLGGMLDCTADFRRLTGLLPV